MEDNQLIDLYFSRDLAGLAAAQEKYTPYCHTVSVNILGSNEDAEECVNDTFFRSWEAIPPHRPNVLRTFLGKICRNHSINRLEQRTAQKRGAGEGEAALAELCECVSGSDSAEDAMDEHLLTEALERFLRSRKKLERMVFLRRYWYCESIARIASQTDLSQSAVKTMLFRTRRALKSFLEEEGFAV